MHDAHLRDAHSVERWTTEDLRRRATAGLPLDASEIVVLLDSIEELQRSLNIPPMRSRWRRRNFGELLPIASGLRR